MRYADRLPGVKIVPAEHAVDMVVELLREKPVPPWLILQGAGYRRSRRRR